MNTSMNKTKWTVSVALMAAVVVVLANTPLGMIQLPIIKATTVHIPVILGAMLLGPLAGAILGGVFGICSIISNTTAPTLLSFAFSPFMTMSGLSGVFKSLWVAFGCRVMLGVFAGFLWQFFKKVHHTGIAAMACTGFVSSVFHTLIVMLSIFKLFTLEYAAAKNVAVDAVWGLIMATITGSGIPEAIAAGVLVAALGKVLMRVVHNL
ncbi:MAG: ECF transporter S component [Eubacteriales bacterium]|nr:ECF transporter S component [Eubacteriales bacterium]